MRKNYPKFVSKQQLSELIDNYFNKIDHHQPATKTKKVKAAEKEDEELPGEEVSGPATIAGLALYLGFTSREQFDNYEASGKFADYIKRARFRVEEAYEKKLQQQSSGVIFALKTLGWHEKGEGKKSPAVAAKTIRMVIVETGPKPVANEKEVDI